MQVRRPVDFPQGSSSIRMKHLLVISKRELAEGQISVTSEDKRVERLR
jgi:hypothetical protein